MTTGSWSTKVVTNNTVTSCSSSSQLINGTSVSWTGLDSVQTVRRKAVLAERRAYYDALVSEIPRTYPKLFLGLVMKPTRAESRESARIRSLVAQGLREAKFAWKSEPLPVTDYREPHPYQKVWEVWKQGVFKWSSAGVPNGTGTIGSCGFSPPQPEYTWQPTDQYKLIERLRNKIVGTDFNLFSFLGAEGRDTIRFIGDMSNRIYRAQKALLRGSLPQALAVLKHAGRKGSHVSSVFKREQLRVYRDLIAQANQTARARSIAEFQRSLRKTRTDSDYFLRKNQRLDDRREALDALTGRRDRHGRERGQFFWEEALADQYLEYQLAIAPLLGDVEAAAQQLAHLTDTPVKRRYTSSLTRRQTQVVGPYQGVCAINQHMRRVNVIAQFVCEPTPFAFTGVLDPEITIWNAIPLSFVADRFLPIGAFLEARANVAHFPVGTYITSSKEELFQRNLKGRTGASASVFVNAVDPEDGLYEWYRRGSFSRTISSVLDVPTPKLKPLGKALTWGFALTAVSLVVGSNPNQYR